MVCGLWEGGCSAWGAPAQAHLPLVPALVQGQTQFIDLLGKEFKGHADVAVFLAESFSLERLYGDSQLLHWSHVTLSSLVCGLAPG